MNVMGYMCWVTGFDQTMQGLNVQPMHGEPILKFVLKLI